MDRWMQNTSKYPVLSMGMDGCGEMKMGALCNIWIFFWRENMIVANYLPRPTVRTNMPIYYSL